MSQAQIEIQLIAAVVAAACALPGVFLVLRRMALMSDAISHSILLGIVIAFFVTEDLTSPGLVAGAALTGLLTVILVESLHNTRRVKEDAAIGLVFPLLFSLGVILIARYAGSVHLDTDAVLLGELAFAPFERLHFWGLDWGPKSLLLMGAVLLLNGVFIALFYKELKIATFDAALAAALGFSPKLIHYGLMAMVSVTAVGSFDAVGSVLVVALMVGPPATAYLLTDRLAVMLFLSAGLGVAGATGGYWLAHLLDASIAGSMATVVGLLFAVSFLLAPQRGLLALYRRRRRQHWEFALSLLTIHLATHEGLPEESQESRRETLHQHLRWSPEFTRQVVERALAEELVESRDGRLTLTPNGKRRARATIER